MRTLLSGSLAYDRIMEFPEPFSDYFLKDKLDNINVCFMVTNMKEKFGGTAGNIAYALKLLGGNPEITATIGADSQRYLNWLQKNEIATGLIKAVEEELTAGAYITTDAKDNQITNFNPGAMKFSSDFDFATMTGDDIMIVSPGCISDMVTYPAVCRQKKLRYIFDPGQSLPALQENDLLACIDGCTLLMVNDYEISLICEKTGQQETAILERAGRAVITRGEKGSSLFENGTEKLIPVVVADEVIDPTGAGDAYRGGMLFGLTQGKTLEESCLLGSVAASFAVACYGTQEYTFTIDQFNARLQSIL